MHKNFNLVQDLHQESRDDLPERLKQTQVEFEPEADTLSLNFAASEEICE